MSDRLDEILHRELGGAAVNPARHRDDLGALIRERAARQDRHFRVATVGAAALVLIAIGSLMMQRGANRDQNPVNHVADARQSSTHTHDHATTVGKTLTDDEMAAMVDELDTTAEFVRQAVERMQSDERTRQLRRQLSQYETHNVIDPAIDQTVAIGLADARRLAAAHPQEATQRLARLVELFPDSGLAATAKQQLSQLQAQEVMP